jgi:putative oxidoreductase
MIDQQTAPYAALLLRVSLGVMFIAHGLLLKVFTYTVAGTAGYFESIGYPGFSPIWSSSAKSAAGSP